MPVVNQPTGAPNETNVEAVANSAHSTVTSLYDRLKRCICKRRIHVSPSSPETEPKSEPKSEPNHEPKTEPKKVKEEIVSVDPADTEPAATN